MVRYYIHGESIKQIAKALDIPENPVKLPLHLKSIPKWQQYMHCCSTFSMRVIMNAHENGLFLADHNLQENPVPAVLLAIGATAGC